MMNVLNLRGKLSPEQAAFMAPFKPEFELFDLKADPFELNNLAEDPEYEEIRAELLAELNAWREKINDEGVTEAFRNQGWPATYPTRSLEEWEEIAKGWETWVYREPDQNDRSIRYQVPVVYDYLE
jgi:uncharacterized sulfatase